MIFPHTIRLPGKAQVTHVSDSSGAGRRVCGDLPRDRRNPYPYASTNRSLASSPSPGTTRYRSRSVTPLAVSTSSSSRSWPV